VKRSNEETAMNQDWLGGAGAPLSIEALLREIEEGATPQYLFFWGHQARTGQTVGKHVLSQWWEREFEVDGIRYPSAEHYMMAEKARMFGDAKTLSLILEAPGPDAAKVLGRRVKDFEEAQWSAGCFDVVVRGNLAKFSQNAELRTYLIGTGEQVLVETSPLDRIWGVGLAADDPRAQNPAQWRGMNLLGFALMKVRAMLRAEEGGCG
jgi:ribA/ribD-fused uncharacterized protein